MNLEQAVRDFHTKFGLDYNGPARNLPTDMKLFRMGFLHEELEEYEAAVVDEDLEAQFDALIDLVYVAIGNACIQGLPFNKGFELVQTANMAKVRAAKSSDSKRGGTYDVIKPPGWVAPNLKPLIIVS